MRLPRPVPALRRAGRLAFALGVLLLAGCGEPAVPSASETTAPPALPDPALLTSPDVTVRRETARALEGAPAGAEAHVEALARALTQDADRWVREAAGRALRDLGPRAAGAAATLVPALRQALGDEDDYVRWRAAEALGRLGAAGAPSLDDLGRHAADADETEVVRASSEAAVRRIRAALDAAGDAALDATPSSGPGRSAR